MSVEESELSLIHFERSNSYRQQIFTRFDKELNGLRTYQTAMHSHEWHKEELYNNWNFTSFEEYDHPPYHDGAKKSFWYSEKTELLYETKPIRIGQTQTDRIVLNI